MEPVIHREQPTLRDMIAIEAAAVLINKTDIVVDYKSTETCEISFRNKLVLSRVAQLAYVLADAMLSTRKQH